MKHYVMLLAAGCLCTAFAFGQNTDEQPDWRIYGDEITLDQLTPLGDALKNGVTEEGKEILVEGTIADVCQNKGCWMILTTGDRNMRVEFKDYGFFVPWDSEGKQVRLQGVLSSKKISAAAAKHMAGEMKHPPIPMEEIKDEQVITVFVASAVSMQGGSELGGEQLDIIEGKAAREGHEEESHDH